MKKCKYCRAEYEGSSCPKCGATGGVEKVKPVESTVNYSMGIMENAKRMASGENTSQYQNNQDRLFNTLQSAAKSLARTIKTIFTTWIICIIIGFVLSHFIKSGNVDIIEKNKDIFVLVKNGLFFFGWALGYLIAKLRK